jgi:hypothetical protein
MAERSRTASADDPVSSAVFAGIVGESSPDRLVVIAVA